MFWLASLALAAGYPAFSVERGVYDAAFSLTITPGVAGEALLVSVDGSAPTLPYAGPLPISGTSVVRAVEVGGDGSVSPTVTHTYVFPADVVAQPAMDVNITGSGDYGPVVLRTLAELPTVSIVAPGGVSSTEGAASAEWIDAEGPDLQVNCGVARTGTTSLGYPKNSLRLYFRSEYGASHVDFDFWNDDQEGSAPASEQDALSLRSGHDSVFYLGAQGQYTRNDWMDASQLAMGHTAPHGGFAHVYLNGEYTGLYHVRERFNDAFLAHYLGGDKEEYESVNEGRVNSGSGLGWGEVMSHAGDVQELQHWLRLDHYLDYMILNYYAGNTWDWSSYHNWAAAGPSERDAGGFRFYSSDSDICIYYDASVNALYLPGPADIFPTLWAAGDPDFKVALEDAIHRNLEDGGPLTPESAGDRYATIAASIEEGVVAESARWGGGWWDRDGEWIPERDRLLNDFFPARTDELLGQLRIAGYYSMPAPTFSLPSGEVTAGSDVSVEVPSASDAELWYTIDGSDPRLSGGAASSVAIQAAEVAVVTVQHGTELRARLRNGQLWGPLGVRHYEVSEPAPLVLNEWNSVGAGDELDVRDFPGSGSDAALGVLPGNGGAWVELVVTEDVDLRGWRMTMQDLRGEAGTITFTEDDALSNLRAGTILTVSAELAQDTSVNPEGGDWRLELTATPEGVYAQSEGFHVSANEWTMSIQDAEGSVRFGPVGEGIAPRRGISAREVGALLSNPSAATQPQSADYGATTRSTYGAPNVWEGGAQNLSGLRGESGVLTEPDTGLGEGSGVDDVGSRAIGCSAAAGPGWVAWVVALVLGHRRRGARPSALPMHRSAGAGPVSVLGRRLAAALLVGVGCSAPGGAVEPGDSGATRDCFADRDGDGHGDVATPVRCEVGVALGDDCADTNAFVYPDAPERCNGSDDDCDSIVDEDPADPIPFYADADGDGYGGDTTLVHACAATGSAVVLAGDCDDADPDVHPGADEGCDAVDRDCDGLASTGLGAAASCPATTCAAILADSPSAPDGAYWLEQPSGSVVEIWCDMNNGGWSLVFVRNTASTGSQGTFGSGEENTASLATSPEAASATAAPALGWVDINAVDWTFLRVTAAASGGRSYTSRDVQRSALRVAFGEPGYLLYGGDSGYYWCGGPSSYTDAGVGAVNNPADAPPDCKGHGSLGSGWDFSESPYANAGLTLCGGDGSYWLAATWGGTWTSYGTVGGAEAIWVR